MSRLIEAIAINLAGQELLSIYRLGKQLRKLEWLCFGPIIVQEISLPTLLKAHSLEKSYHPSSHLNTSGNNFWEY